MSILSNRPVINFKCPHCQTDIDHVLNDLDLKVCKECGNNYGMDDLGSALKIGEICQFEFDGESFKKISNMKKTKHGTRR